MTRDAAIVTKAYTSAYRPAGWPRHARRTSRCGPRGAWIKLGEPKKVPATEVIADITIYAGPGPCRVGRDSDKQIGGMLERAVNRSNAQGRGDAKGR
jgi:hypothetical protein